MTSHRADASTPNRRAVPYVDALPALGPKIRSAGFSMMGTRRTANQDDFYIDPANRYFVVADGMGGHQAGEQASRMAVEILSRHAQNVIRLRSDLALIAALRLAFDTANQWIVDEATRRADLAGMGTTAVLAALVRDRLHVASAGDSRVYLVRNGVAQPLTVDQTVAQLMVEAGVYDGVPWQNVPNRNMLWNCLGRSDFVAVDPRVTLIQPHDRIIIASDGLSDFVEADALPGILENCDDPCDAAEQLVVMSQQQGSRDDSTCIVIYCEPAGGIDRNPPRDVDKQPHSP